MLLTYPYFRIKYIIEYNLFKQIDERYDDIDSKSHKKIKNIKNMF